LRVRGRESGVGSRESGVGSREGVKAGRRGCPKGAGARPGKAARGGACVASRKSGRPRPGAGVAPGAETRLFEPPGLRSQGRGQGRVKAGAGVKTGVSRGLGKTHLRRSVVEG